MTDRQTKILEIVNQKKKVEVVTLSQMLEVSQVTIRKDLDALEELNFLTREHGYATMKNMSDISNRMAFCYETKQRIAEKASEIISDGETIMVESGSSCALLVKYLSETKKDITVITNSSYIARFIRETEGGVTKVIVLGGEYQKEAEVMVGPLVKTCAEALYGNGWVYPWHRIHKRRYVKGRSCQEYGGFCKEFYHFNRFQQVFRTWSCHAV